MSSYEFDKEAQEEILFWKERARKLEDALNNIVALHETEFSLGKIDIALEKAKELLK